LKVGSAKESGDRLQAGGPICGLTGWLAERLLGWLRGRRRAAPRLALVERISLAPRQSLALVEAEGRRILVATSADGGPAFYPLDEAAQTTVRSVPRSPAVRVSSDRISTGHATRVSW
jgi:hypothetical protein